MSETRQETELFRSVFEAVPDAVVVVDRGGRIVLANGQCTAVFGVEPDVLVGRPVEELVPTRFRGNHPGRRDGYEGRRHRRAMGLLQLSARRGDGSEFPAEISLAPLDVDGEHLTAAVVRDITARKRDEDRFRSLLEAAPDAMVIVDDRARIKLANAQVTNLFGYEQGELLGRPVEVLVPERFRATHPADRDRFLATPGVRPMGSGRQLYAVRKDGTEFPVEISLSPLDTDEGVWVSAAVRDISERLAMHEASHRMREELIATVSHELRTPLASILGYTELLSELPEEHLSGPARRMLAVIDRNARRELRLVDDLLTLAFLNDRRMPVALVPVDLARVVANAAEAARPDARSRGVRLDVRDGEVPAVLGDAMRLGQVVDNLLANALKFTPPGGRVELRLAVEDGTARLDVADTGPGMRPEDVERVFERLYRTQDAVAAQVPGAGLGLPIVQAIVEAHAGEVSVSSVLGEGTVFSVRLPLAAPEDQNSRCSESSMPRSAS